MGASFTVTVEPERDLIRLTLAGLFETSDAHAFDRQRRAGMRGLRCRPNQHLTLVDISAMKIQPQDILPLFADILADPRTHARRLAFVTGASLARMQIKRLPQRASVAVFATAAAAEGWLFAGSMPLARTG